MSKARGLADLGNAYDDGALSNRNLLVNGGMTISQRGISNGPNATNGVLALDRWYINSSGGTKTVSQEAFTLGQTDVPNFPKNYMRLAVTTGDNNLGVHQRVEDVTVLGGQTVTLSFWAKGTNPAGGSFVSSWIQNFGDGGSATVETEAKSGIVLTSSWQKFTITVDLPSVSGKTIGTSSYTWVELLRQPATDTGTAGWTADIAQAQLEVGDTATPFEHRSYGDELARCQRYFQKLPFTGAGYQFTATHVGSGSWRSAIRLPVPLRATPTVSTNYSSATNDMEFIDGGSTINVSSISGAFGQNEYIINFNGSLASSPTTGNAAVLYQRQQNTWYAEVEAEL